MAKYDFEIKRGDRRQPIEAFLRDGAGASVNLSGTTVRFHMVEDGGVMPKVNSPATIINPATGHVRYEWVAEDTDTAGLYNAEWEVTFGDGTILTFPNNRHLTINIYPDLA